VLSIAHAQTALRSARRDSGFSGKNSWELTRLPFVLASAQRQPGVLDPTLDAGEAGIKLGKSRTQTRD
jgi:hypothetical protein